MFDALLTMLGDAVAASGGRDVQALAPEALRRLRSPQGATADVAVELEVTAGTRSVRLCVALSPTFPRALPDIYLVEPEAHPLLAHVHAATGWICYLSNEGLSISRRDPRAVVAFAVGEAIRVLSDAVGGRSGADVADELAAYWRQFADESSAACLVTPGDTVKAVEYTVEGDRVRYVADSMSQVRSLFPRATTTPARTGVYVPLTMSARDGDLDPRAFSKMERVRELLAQHVSPDQAPELRRLLERTRSPQLVLLGVPRPDGSRVVVALRCPAPRGTRRPDERTPRRNRLVGLERCDLDYLRLRGGATNGLERAHVVLVGCGSVGGHLALALAHAGVGRIALIDPDVMSIENTFRHCLGRAAHGIRKTAALAADIHSRLPEIRVDDHPVDAAEATRRGVFGRGDVDLVVVAIGDPSESRHLNEMLRSSGVPAVFTWLEPLGLGGHALATLPSTAGCYECLFADEDGRERLAARTDFVAPGQKFSRDIAGCATAFTPYADLDSRQTADMAARLSLRVLSKSETSGALVSWKGDAGQFRASGFRVSARWGLSDDELQATRDSFASPGCPVCSSLSTR